MKATTPYITFDGNCRQAMSFYQKALGAELRTMSFADMPPANGAPPMPAEFKDRIMHAALIIKNMPVVMASDTMPGMSPPFQAGNNFSVAVGCESVQEAEKFFAALSEKGKVTMPLQETFWATRFGMFTDQFGINWMLNFDKPQPVAMHIETTKAN